MKFVNNFLNNETFFVKIFFYYFKICGVAPINLIQINRLESGNRKNWMFTYSWFNVLSNFCLICLLTLDIMPSIFIWFKNINFAWLTIIKSCLVILRTTTKFFGIIVSCCRQKKMKSIANSINEIINLSDSIKNETVKKKEMKLRWRLQRILFFNFIIKFAIITIKIVTRNNTLTLMNIFMTNAIFLQYLTILEITRHFFVLLNCALKEIGRNSEFFKIKIIRQNESAKLNVLQKAHTYLYKVTKEISDFYSVFILLFLTTITMNSMNLLFENFKVIEEMIDFVKFDFNVKRTIIFLRFLEETSLLFMITMTISDISNKVIYLFLFLLHHHKFYLYLGKFYVCNVQLFY